MKRPIIGITAVTSSDEKDYIQRMAYVQAIWNAGGEAILLPCNSDKSNVIQIVSILDGLLAPGGKDIDPALYGEKVIDSCGKFHLFEDEYDMALVKETVKQRKPVMGICRGMQLINVLYGGTLYQDIPTQHSKEITHTRIIVEENYHTVKVTKDSYLANVIGQTGEIKVNTSHHQAVKDVAEGFSVSAIAPDGIIEAIENKETRILCVQWHPERLQNMEIYRKLIKDFVKKCR
jgi:putative glutamine amidotransferase